MLFLANIAIIAIDVTTVTLEFLALWGVWCSFKGFGYSVKLKIEFAILNQLRDSVKNQNSSSLGYGQHSNKGIDLSSHGMHNRKSQKPPGSVLERQTFSELEEDQHITKTIDISVERVEHTKANPYGHTVPGVGKHGGLPSEATSKASSEIDFAGRGV